MQVAVRAYLDDYEKESYVQSDESTYVDKDTFVDCSLGTNPFGFSKTIDRVLGEIDLLAINHYPEYPYVDLVDKVINYWADVIQLNHASVQIGNGSMQLLNTINKMLVDEGTKVLGYTPQFTEYSSNVESFGGKYESIPLININNYKFDADTFIEKMGNEYQIIYIDNPNNPTGQLIDIQEIQRIVGKAESVGAVVIVDEAYGDFVPIEASAISLIDTFENLIVVRSLSKGFGVAGLRVGYLVSSPSLMKYYQKIELPFTVTSLGYNIALKVMDDYNFILDCIDGVRRNKMQLLNVLDSIKVHHTFDSVPIMVLEHPNQKVNFHELLMNKGFLTESGEHFRNLEKNHVRLRIPKDIGTLISAIEEIELEIREQN